MESLEPSSRTRESGHDAKSDINGLCFLAAKNSVVVDSTNKAVTDTKVRFLNHYASIGAYVDSDGTWEIVGRS